MPYGTHLSSISTGSKLMNWMKAKGEADHAKDEIAWAEMEEDPKIIDPRSPCVKIQEMEKMIKLGKAGEYVLKQDTTENDICTLNSCSPWPFVPFSYETERLTSIIDLDHLVVHDPWNLLAVSSQNNLSLAASYKDQEWTSMEDITHVYKLNYRNVVSNLVPKFYGFILIMIKAKRKHSGYLSPILLLEDCGSPVDPKQLTCDQRNEALSLFHRFHYAGWVHNSAFARNILIQPSPISLPPSKRNSENPSFRLIDFGRSYHCEKSQADFHWNNDKYFEKSLVENLFDL
ncbi:hypothetical protein J132_07005 [Termitomyces sp. J132]|nr:hypothetical protein J132_07005 [Termitomyces sp. J132]